MLKKVMKRAHELAKDMIGHYAARLALALRQAWSEVKGLVANETGAVTLPNLKGSEKQVKWANDVREAVVKTFEEAAANYVEGYKQNDSERFAKREEKINTTYSFVRENILVVEDAKFWIDNFGYSYKDGKTVVSKIETIAKEKKGEVKISLAALSSLANFAK